MLKKNIKEVILSMHGITYKVDLIGFDGKVETEFVDIYHIKELKAKLKALGFLTKYKTGE